MKRTVLLLLLVLVSVGCFGPKPRIARQQLQPPQDKGGPWLLAVTVANDGRGEGAAEVTSRLRDAHGEVVAQEARELDLKPHETVTVTIEMRPAKAGPYAAASEVEAPPE